MARYLLFGLLALLWCCSPAEAQRDIVVATCGTLNVPAPLPGTAPIRTWDTSGRECSSASGGSGGDATAANQTLQITQETLTNTTLGTTASPAATAGSTGDVSAKLRLMTTQLDSILAAIGSSIPSGGFTIGNFNTAPNVTPTECGGTRAGSASDAFTATATKHGFTLQNISDVAMWIRFTGTAAPSGINSFLLNSGQIASSVAGGSLFIPVGFNTALSVYGTGDFSCVWW